MSEFLTDTSHSDHAESAPCTILLNSDYLIMDANENALINLFESTKEEIYECSLVNLFVEKNIDVDSLKEALQCSENLTSYEIRIYDCQKEKTYETTVACFDLIFSNYKYFFITMKETTHGSYQNLKAYMDAVINNLPGAIYWKDPEGHYMGCNKHVAQMAGYENVEEMIGKTDYDFCWNAFAADWQTLDQEVMRTGRTISREEKVRLADGRIITELTYKTPLRNEFNQIVGVIGTSLDISDKKELERQLIEAKEKAEKALRAEEELKRTRYQLEGAKLISGSIAHEIRTPLATIKSGVHGIGNTLAKLIALNQFITDKNLAIEAVSDEEIASAKKAISTINRKVDQSNVIINMLLTKLQSIHFEFSEFSVCSAGQCIQNSIKEFILPDYMVNKLIFKKANDFKFMGNSTLIIHIIMNLLKNAIFYILKAGKGEIVIWFEQHEIYNEIHFKDTGTGISPRVLPHIFDSFFTTESSTGTGVGLAFSKMVMQSHQGKIECLSKQGEYAEFILSFPKLDRAY